MSRLSLSALTALILALALAVAACEPDADPELADPQDPAPVDDEAPEPDDDVDPPDAVGEAPMLAERVGAGELPPVEERLPDNPLVVQPHDRVGVYGGQWNTVAQGPIDDWLRRSVGYEGLMRWDFEYTEPIPNVVERVEVDDDATEYIFHLRQGIKWSDGEPFTADDVLFWWEDVQLHLELGGGPPSWMRSGPEDTPAEVSALDEHTVRIHFPGGGQGLLLPRFATSWDGNAPVNFPRHYLEQFHVDHNPDIDQLVADEGFGSWVDLFDTRAGSQATQLAPGLPTLRPWKMGDTDWGEGTRISLERNPYYWKVDTEGNQLPYIDRVVFDIFEDAETVMFRALNGELHFETRHITDLANLPVLADNREQGNYDFINTVSTLANLGAIQLNMTHRDPELRELFQNKDVRIALSHAIDRQEIIDVVLVEQGEPMQAAARPEADYFNEQLAYQYTEFDLDLANEHMDAAGYTERDAQGYRLLPNGERISFAVDVGTGPNIFWEIHVAALEMIEPTWAEIGVDMRINALDRSLAEVRKEDGDHDALVWSLDGGAGYEGLMTPRPYFPENGAWASYAPAWGYWFNDPEHPLAEEPPDAVRRQMELYNNELLGTPHYDEQVEVLNEIIQIAADEFHMIGLINVPDHFGIVRNDFHNVPEEMPLSSTYPTPAPANPEQFFIQE